MLRPSTKNILLLIAVSALPMFAFQNCSRVQFGMMDDGPLAAKGSPAATTNEVVDPTTGSTDVVDSDDDEADSDTTKDSDTDSDTDTTADNDTDTDTDSDSGDKDNGKDVADKDTSTDTDTNSDGDECESKTTSTADIKASETDTRVFVDDSEKKVLICHVPPGNPENRKTLEISVNGRDHGHAPGAHGGDFDGPCEDLEDDPPTIDTCSL